ncbi:hypothetical protein MTO96_036109 [Rhipicephalus appendiculatus]
MFATAGEDVQLWCSSSVQPCLRFDVDESRVRTVTSLSWSADGVREKVNALTVFTESLAAWKTKMDSICME